MDGTDRTEPNESTARPPLFRRPRRVPIPVVVAFMLVASAFVVVASWAITADDAPAVVRRNDPAADLLGWLPASEEHRRAFAVWVDEGALGGTPPAVMDITLQQGLGLAPYPGTLGLDPGWREAFGWAAGDVDSWAIAGEPDDGIAILAGEFDLDAVGDALERAGYRSARYRGATLYLLQPVATPAPPTEGVVPSVAQAVAVLAGRLITAPSEAAVRAAIDAALGEAPALADDPAVASLLRTAGPSVGLAAIDAADLAAVCAANDPTARHPSAAPSGRYAALAYGTVAPGGPRQTVLAVTLGDAAAAQGAVTAWEYGWVDAEVALGDVAASAASYATIASAGAAGDALIARFTDGRVDGWAPLALRLASPVCAAVGDLTPPEPPPALDPPPTAAERRAIALAALPDAGEGGTFVFADLAATGAVRGVVAPTAANGQAPPADRVATWQTALSPLPDLTVLPSDPAALAQLPVVFGIGLDEVWLVAEARTTEPNDTVGLVLGGWDPARIEELLRGLGYESIRLGEAVVFAAPLGAALPSWAPAAWTNLALVGDRLLLSPSGAALRRALDDVPAPASVRSDLLALAPDAASGLVVGAEAARHDCAAREITGQAPAWRAFAAVWSPAPDGDRAAFAALPAAGLASRTLAAELDDRLDRLRLVVADDAGTPAAAGPLAIEALGYQGSRIVQAPSGGAVVAAFAVPVGTPAADAFYATADQGCALAARP